MSQSPPPIAGPSSHAAAAPPDANLLRNFVMEYLQQHGFDKALSMFQQGIADHGDDKDADGEDEPMAAGPTGAGRRGSAGGREAIFRAAAPVPIESTLKRNIPQAQSFSASAMSDKITPEFEAQARYIVEQLQRKNEAAAEGGDKEVAQESILDPSDRTEGYKRYRRWVDNGLDLWKLELNGLSFPLFVYTYLDLIHYGFNDAARKFFEANKASHEPQHPQEIATLSAVTTRQHLRVNPLCQRFLGGKYTVPLSRNSHDLLLQWLSGAGLEEAWEYGLHNAAGRAKEAVKAIVQSRISISVTNSSIPLDKIILASSSGLLSSLVPTSLDSINSTPLKLGLPPMTDRLREQVSRNLSDEEAGANGHATPSDATDAPNGNGHADANGDVEMADGHGETKLPTANEVKVKVEPDIERDPTVISPTETETLPPIPQVFRIADLKREVEAIRDRRKMIRLGPGTRISPVGEDGRATVSSPAILPSVVAFTIFDGGEGVSSVQFSNDSSLMAVGSPESCIRLWSLKGEKLKAKALDPSDGSLTEDDGLPMRKLIGHSGPVYSLSFDPIYGTAAAPQSLLSSSQDGSVRLWSLDTYSNLVVYRGHSRDPVWDVEWGPMGVYFATGSRDRTAKLWSSERVTPLRMYTGHLSDVNCVKFHPNSLYLATGSSDNSCRLWDVQRGACIRLFLGHTDAITTMAISPDGRTLASAGLDCSIWLWDLGSSRPIKQMKGHTAPIQSLAFSAESSLVISGGLDATVRCWDAKSSGEEGTSMRTDGVVEGARRGSGDALGREHGELPMGRGDLTFGEGEFTSDLLSTFYTKRTPIVKVHHTPRNLCMVAGTFIPPSNK
ncbi:WD40-repeat-containing domain protein [Naematelia encephala]|uniref:WD40-repeat-containing domain protein n=1 Tax=Naematelia encephala TaxID=71784 RepID=A0A1Y2B4N6_9TREE|nr:WD40-repeat-containing domain protein [Naematelia encephala]